MASQRALLVVYLVSLVYVRSAKCLGRKEVVLGGRLGGWAGLGSHQCQSGTDLEASLYSLKLSPKPHGGDKLSWGEIIIFVLFYFFVLINYLRKILKKRNSFFKC
ncbi:hypothetical protein ILYODFUR_015217 [Ilyodon furcidens]|uniref:Uncharacterized protein n=1 Tax=Ilyodon furcidens TaxID=33524 RepID=A0ABV0SZF1_9TELE